MRWDGVSSRGFCTSCITEYDVFSHANVVINTTIVCPYHLEVDIYFTTSIFGENNFKHCALGGVSSRGFCTSCITKYDVFSHAIVVINKKILCPYHMEVDISPATVKTSKTEDRVAQIISRNNKRQ